MNADKPDCGHAQLILECAACEQFKTRWYQKISADNVDIEYGLEHPERLYSSVDLSVDPAVMAAAMAFSDRVLELSRLWEKSGRRRRDYVLAELFGEGKTVREIGSELRAKRLKPRSIGAIHNTIQEINEIVLKSEHRHLGESNARTRARVIALSPLDSKPKKDEADGQEDLSSAGARRAA